MDADMRKLARTFGIGKSGYSRLSLMKLSCRETRSARRVREALSLIEHEWQIQAGRPDRRININIGDEAIRTHR